MLWSACQWPSVSKLSDHQRPQLTDLILFSNWGLMVVKGRISARNLFLSLNLDPCVWSENFQVIDKNRFIILFGDD